MDRFGHRALRAGLMGAVGAVAISGSAWAQTKAFDIPAQPASTAVAQLGRQASVQILLAGSAAKNRTTKSLRGTYTVDEALGRMLEGTGLVARMTGPSTYVVTVEARPAPTPASSATDPESSTSAISELVVTAQKYEQRIQDVPIPVSVVSAQSLVDKNQLRLQDYVQTIPGFSLTPTTQSGQTIAIRGITTGGGNPSVSITVDDIPYNAATNLGGGRVIPDIDPGALERIEVLRGPQGTLYGSSSLGGLLKFVTRDPSTAGFTARVQVGAGGIENGQEASYNLRGAINVPLAETLAMRLSAFQRRDAGYVDNIRSGEEAINSDTAHGGHFALMWRPDGDTSLKLSALYQRIKGKGSDSVDFLLGDLQQDRIPGTGAYVRTAQAYSAVFKTSVGAAEITSLTGYSKNSFNDSQDSTTAYAASALRFFNVRGGVLTNYNTAHKFTQELRVALPINDRFDWQVGAYYTDEDSNYGNDVFAVAPDTGAIAGTLLHDDIPSTFRELAVFSNVTFHVTDRFDIQVGARESKIRQAKAAIYIGPLATPNQLLTRTKTDAFTYMFSPQYRITPDAMVYIRLSSGYRIGGSNAAQGVPLQQDPDSTRNYEIGVKASFLDDRVSIDASAYYIDWKDIQINLTNAANIGYGANGSRAKSEGVEVSSDVRPFRGLRLNGWVSYNNAVLTENFPAGPTFGLKGDRLPLSPKWSWYLSADQTFPLWDDVEGFVSGSLTHVGERYGQFRPTAVRSTTPGYTRADLNAGVRGDSWSANAFVTNIGDKRAILNGGPGALPAGPAYYIQPRSYGVSLAKSF